LLLKQPAAPPAAAKTAGASSKKPLRYLVRQMAVNGLEISFRDKMMKSEPLFTLNDIRLTTANLTGPKFSGMPIAFSARYGKNAPIRITGRLTPQPFSYKGTVALSRLPVRDFEDYIPQSVNLFFVAGTLDSTLKLNIALAADGRPTGSFSGKAGLRSFHVVDTMMEEDLLKWESLQLDELSGNLAPFSLSIRQIALNNAYARVAIRKDQTLNLQNLITKEEPKQQEHGAPDQGEKRGSSRAGNRKTGCTGAKRPDTDRHPDRSGWNNNVQ